MLILVGVIFFISLLKKPKPKSVTAPLRKAYPVVATEIRTIVGYDEYPTTIQGKNNNSVYAKISGYITKVYVDEGDYVKKGQILFKLETAALSQEANAAKAGIHTSDSQIELANAAILTAQVQVEAAQIEVNKLIPLVEKNIISPIQLETARANLNTAQSRLGQAVAAKNQAVASKGQVEAGLNTINANIDYSVIRAPISGVVGKINFREGGLVGPANPTPLTIVSETGEVYAYFSMNEREYLDFLAETQGRSLSEKLKKLPEVDLVLANHAIYEQKGRIETVTGQINPQTGTVQFRAVFDNKNQLLSNGNSGMIRIPKAYNQVVVVPEQATFEQQGVTYVYKLKGDTAISAIITIKDRSQNLAIVAEGLKEGEQVVANGVGSLRTGTLIQPQVIPLDSIIHAIQPVFK